MPRVFITGAAKRVGALIASRFAELGWDLVLHYNQSEEDVENLAESLKHFGVDIEVIKIDFNLSSQLESFIFDKPVNLLINNAAIFENDNILSITASALEAHMRVNLIAPALLMKAFAIHSGDLMRDMSIINMLDCDICSPLSNFTSYHLSKAALHHLTRAAANQLAPKIRVNGIALGQMVKNERQSLSAFEKSVEFYPLKTSISNSSLYNALSYLIETDNVTGQVLFIDSGASLRFQL